VEVVDEHVVGADDSVPLLAHALGPVVVLEHADSEALVEHANLVEDARRSTAQ